MKCKLCGREVEVRQGAVGVTCAICITNRMNPAPPDDLETPQRPCPASVQLLLRKSCANHVAGQHVTGRLCSVLQGYPCPYFENIAIPCIRKDDTAGQKAAHDYATTIGKHTTTSEGRRCKDCNAIVGPRIQYCKTCAKRRRKGREAERQRRLRKRD